MSTLWRGRGKNVRRNLRYGSENIEHKGNRLTSPAELENNTLPD